MNPGSLGGPVEVPGGIMLVALIDKRRIGSDPRQAVLNMKQIAISFPPGTTEAQTASRVEAFNAATRRGGCGTAEAVAQKFDAEVVANDSLRLGELPEQLQEIVGRLQVGEATPPFGSLAAGVRGLILFGRGEGRVITPSVGQEIGRAAGRGREGE